MIGRLLCAHAGARGAANVGPGRICNCNPGRNHGVSYDCRPAARSGCVSAASRGGGLWSGAFVATSGTRTPRRKGLAGSLVAVAGDCVVGCAQRLPRLLQSIGRERPKQGSHSGCDLDCGQDLYRLCGGAFGAQHVRTCTLPCGGSAELSYMGLPRDGSASAFHPVTGWVAISARSLRFGDVFHTTDPPHASTGLIGTRRNNRWARRSGSITFRLTLQRLMRRGQGKSQ